jgi:hypothetical protein
VYAEAKTRASIWEGLWARRTYGVTGDRIELDLRVNGAMMGATIPWAAHRHIQVSARGWDDIAMIEVLKNNRVIYRYFPEDHALPQATGAGTVLCRVEFGWGPWAALGIPRVTDWLFEATVERSRFCRYMPCFQSGPMDEERRNRVLEFGRNHCRWQSYTSRGGSFSEIPTNALVFEIEAVPGDTLHLQLKSPVERGFAYELGSLAQSSEIEFTADFPCESFIVHRLVTEPMYSTEFELDDVGTHGTEFYYVRVTQANGHMAWSSPIWIGE